MNPQKRPWIRMVADFVARNATPKLMALVMAIALWLYAFNFSYIATDQSNPMRVPLTITPAPGWSVAQVGNRMVEVSASYPRRFENQVEQGLRNGTIRIEVQAAPEEVESDEQTIAIPVRESNLIAPQDFGIRVTRMRPSELTIQMIRETTANVRVIPKLSEPPPGYEVTAREPFPATIQVRGRKDVVSHLAETGIETAEIDISTPPPLNQVDWVLPPQPAQIPSEVTIDGETYPIRAPNTVQVRVSLTQEAQEAVFSDIPVRLMIPADYPYTATLLREQSMSATVTGPPYAVRRVEAENILLFVDVSRLQPSAVPHTQPIETKIVNLPQTEGLTVRAETPDAAVQISEPPSP